MGPTTLSDAELVARLVLQDDAAMAAFYDRFSPLVHAIARRMLRDPQAAEDLTEDVFVECWRRAATYAAERGSVATWVATITRSRGIDRLRRRRQDLQGDQVLESLPDAGDSPADAVVDSDEARRVAEALRGLSPEQRSALELAYFDGLSHQEIARTLARPLGTIKTHIRQGLIRLRDMLRIRQGEAS